MKTHALTHTGAENITGWTSTDGESNSIGKSTGEVKSVKKSIEEDGGVEGEANAKTGDKIENQNKNRKERGTRKRLEVKTTFTLSWTNIKMHEDMKVRSSSQIYLNYSKT